MSDDTVGALAIPAAARLRRGDLIRVLGPGSWELADPEEYIHEEPRPVVIPTRPIPPTEEAHRG